MSQSLVSNLSIIFLKIIIRINDKLKLIEICYEGDLGVVGELHTSQTRRNTVNTSSCQRQLAK